MEKHGTTALDIVSLEELHKACQRSESHFHYRVLQTQPQAQKMRLHHGSISVTSQTQILEIYLWHFFIIIILGVGWSWVPWYLDLKRSIVPAPADRWEVWNIRWKPGRGNWSTQRKPAPVPLCPPQVPHKLTLDWNWATVALMTLPFKCLNPREEICITYKVIFINSVFCFCI
jgi:hypothetical protein